MPTNLNTQRIITTLREPPCNWLSFSTYGIGPERDGNGFPYAVCQVLPTQATMKAVFSPDLPEHIAVRNMNYLLVFVTAAGAPDAIPRLTNHIGRIAADPEIFHHMTSAIVNTLRITLEIDKQRSLTIITIRPCKARVYETQ